MTTVTGETVSTDQAIDALLEMHGESHRQRITEGVARLALHWTPEDGDEAALADFCREYYVADVKEHTRLVDRFETMLQTVQGHLYEIQRTNRRWADLRGDEFPPIDDLMAKFDPAPDLSDQFYRQKIAFVALLNFNRPDLATMIKEGDTWSINQWAEIRLCQVFGPRIPSEVSDLARELGHEASMFVSQFHIPVDRMVDADGKKWFEQGRKLIAHWLVRDEIKSAYNDPGGLAKQRALAWVMARHIDGTIPEAVMSGEANGDWDPQANTVDGGDPGPLLGTVRYERWLDMLTVAKAYDKHHVEHPTAIARKFELAREIPEEEVERLLIELLSAPVRTDLAAYMSKRLGRPLEAFDIYYDELAQGKPSAEMNERVRTLCADEKELQAKLPEILRGLGYTDEDADFLGRRIRIEIAKGAGHAMRPGLVEYDAWLRTSRLEKEVGWDGFDTAMHEMGHNLEQLISTHFVPRPALRNVPNTACTEAFAFLYQSLAKRVLGIEPDPDEPDSFDIDTVQTMLAACQIAGPSLVELYVWRWLYENPDATPEAFRDQLIAISDDVWAKYYQAHFGDDPYHILGAYQHMVAYSLYLPDYTLGHIISHQIRSHMRGKDLAAETKRICGLGRFTPELWMTKAVGRGISAAALIEDTAAALPRI
jgi:HAMP domain-containing protein